MSKKQSFFAELMSRRVLHFVGVYIAALWLAVEIADWMSEKFSVSQQFSTYVFVGMLSLLPMIILFAWGHGRPGKDTWSKTELIWLPANLVLAYFVVQYVVNENSVEMSKSQKTAALPLIPEPKVLPSPTLDSMKTFEEVDKPPNHHSVVSFFWENKTNDPAYDWMRYGASWLVSEDLSRTPALSVSTPYDSRSMLNAIKEKGFEDAVNIPKALALQIATNRSAKWMILGSFQKISGTLSFTASVIDVITGNELKIVTSTDDNSLTALDKISKDISLFLHEGLGESKNIIAGLPISEHTSTNLEAINSLIDAKNHVSFENDYDAGLEDIKLALEKDPTFASADILAASYYRLTGDVPNAIESYRKALKLDYKIYQETVFGLKANLFGLTGEIDKAMTVLKNWVKVYPTSTLGLSILGRNYMFLNQLEEAKDVYEKLIQIDDQQDGALVNLGRIYRLEDNKEKAIQTLKINLERNPDREEAYIELADAYKQFMLLDDAEKYYEHATTLGTKNFTAEIGLAIVESYKGNFIQAIEKLNNLFETAENDQQRLNILNNVKAFYLSKGMVVKARETNERIKPIAQTIFNPLNYLFAIEGSEIEYKIMTGEFESAHRQIDSMIEESKPPFSEIIPSFKILVYEAQKDFAAFDKTIVEFEEFLQGFPMPVYDQLLLTWQGKSLTRKGEFESALENFDKALAASRKSFVRLQSSEIVLDIMFSKAESLTVMQRYNESLDILDSILEQNPPIGRVHYLKAKNYKAMNDKKNMLEEIQKAKDFWSDADENYIFLRLLNELNSEEA